jgi:hypothetical protein
LFGFIPTLYLYRFSPIKPCFKVNLSENIGRGERKRETGRTRETLGERQLEERELERDRGGRHFEEESEKQH